MGKKGGERGRRKKEEEGERGGEEEEQGEFSVHHLNEIFQSAVTVLWESKSDANRAWEGVEVMEGRKGNFYQTSITNELQYVTQL